MLRASRLCLGLLTVLVTSVAVSHGDPPPADKVTLQNVKYDELVKLIRGLKGKVVVVDFWADFCLPCKREFPHLVELNQKYARDGLAAVSVALDGPDKPEARERVLKFLQARQATFTNLYLDEPSDVWLSRLKIDGPPCVYVLNRDNRIVKKLPVGEQEPVDYAAIEKIVVEQLKK